MTRPELLKNLWTYTTRCWWKAPLREPGAIRPTLRFALTRRLTPFTTGSGYRIENRQQLICWWDHHIDARLYRGWRARPGETVLDIGANEGVFGWETKHRYPQAKIIGFEPVLPLAQKCEKLGCYFQVHPVALSDGAGRRRLLIRSCEGSFTATIEDNPLCSWEQSCAMPTDESWVESIRLDDFPLPPPAIVKIDVDGGELAVIRGGLNTLRSARAVICEIFGPDRIAEISRLLFRNPIKITDCDYLFKT